MIEAKNLSEKKVRLFQDTHDSYIADYGFEKKGFDSNFSIMLTCGDGLKKLKARGSCGCTKVKPTQIDENNVQLDIQYDSKLLGRILKSVKVTTEKDSLEIKLRGTISN